MDKEIQIIQDTLKMIQEVQRLMADVQADLKAFKENGFSWS